ncbi:chromate efflux transporter [Paenibacillus sp. GCM10023252]|uniref:chromate efflux transporter n=1 Tax=Paenibacillus sp. GCM10023252 TaxID=3252649 RepID=UPI00361A84F9
MEPQAGAQQEQSQSGGQAITVHANSIHPSNELLEQGRSAVVEVFWTALKLGLTSFGGPSAHIGYFRNEYVERKRWLSEGTFAELTALCQFLPGPASSQLGMAIGMRRAGSAGAAAAWLGFTLPSALLMFLFAYAAGSSSIAGAGWLQGLKLAAVAIVASAVWSMSTTLAPDRKRATLAISAACAALLLPGVWGQLIPLVVCAAIGLAWLQAPEAAVTSAPAIPAQRRRYGAWLALTIFVILMGLLPLAARTMDSPLISLADNTYRAGALVFGGGHVVLPMLEQEVVGAAGGLTTEQFMAGYGAVQAVPGPLFTFAAYIGAAMTEGPQRMLYAAVAIAFIFLPSYLLLAGALPYWSSLQRSKRARTALMGVNAGVVGLLLAALYNPVWIDTVKQPLHFVMVLLAFLMLHLWRRQPWQVVLFAATAGLLFL